METYGRYIYGRYRYTVVWSDTVLGLMRMLHGDMTFESTLEDQGICLGPTPLTKIDPVKFDRAVC